VVSTALDSRLSAGLTDTITFGSTQVCARTNCKRKVGSNYLSKHGADQDNHEAIKQDYRIKEETPPTSQARLSNMIRNSDRSSSFTIDREEVVDMYDAWTNRQANKRVQTTSKRTS
jgi:hypothetical protein